MMCLFSLIQVFCLDFVCRLVFICLMREFDTNICVCCKTVIQSVILYMSSPIAIMVIILTIAKEKIPDLVSFYCLLVFVHFLIFLDYTRLENLQTLPLRIVQTLFGIPSGFVREKCHVKVQQKSKSKQLFKRLFWQKSLFGFFWAQTAKPIARKLKNVTPN